MVPAALAAISAIGALAQAGGGIMDAMGGADAARKARRQQDKWHEEGLEQQHLENKMAQQRLGLEAEQLAAQRPNNMLNFISGLEDLKSKRSKSGNNLEMLRSLAGR